MKYLILVKHSLPKVVENMPAREWLLSEEGETRAQTLAEKLRTYQPEVIVSSAEPKAIQTAEIVAHKLQLNLTVVEDLHEHDRRKTAYLSEHAFESSVQKFFDNPGELTLGSETANEAHARFSLAVRALLKQHENKTIIIVSHGTVISLFVSRLLGIPAFPLWHELGLPSFVVLDTKSNTMISRENIP